MNEQKNIKEAMREKAESDAIVKVKNAEAEGAQMRIMGKTLSSFFITKLCLHAFKLL